MNAFLERHAVALLDARHHARRVYPEESCGFIVNDRYVALANRAANPSTHVESDPECQCRLCAFEIASDDYITHVEGLQAIVHSHPNGQAEPSRSDMVHQTKTDVAWIILTPGEENFGETVAWGGDCPRPALIGRHFIHGIQDCYTLIRDVFALGSEGMMAQDMDWPLPPIVLPEYPRANAWWEMTSGNDLYQENYAKAGFQEVSGSDARPGDVFLTSIRSERLNHGGVLLSNGLILHHLPDRLSRREPSGVWDNCAKKWIRYA